MKIPLKNSKKIIGLQSYPPVQSKLIVISHAEIVVIVKQPEGVQIGIHNFKRMNKISKN